MSYTRTTSKSVTSSRCASKRRWFQTVLINIELKENVTKRFIKSGKTLDAFRPRCWVYNVVRQCFTFRKLRLVCFPAWTLRDDNGNISRTFSSRRSVRRRLSAIVVLISNSLVNGRVANRSENNSNTRSWTCYNGGATTNNTSEIFRFSFDRAVLLNNNNRRRRGKRMTCPDNGRRG